MNFGISIDDGPMNEKRLRLELNPDTSIDDIKMHWRLIRELQKELFPNFKKVNLTEKKTKNMGIAVKDLESRSRGGLTKFDSEKFRKYKAYDLDLAGSLWPDEKDISIEVDLKRRNNLRQIRRRFKQNV